VKRVAYFSPLNPLRSGISDYSEDLLPHLREHLEIDLFVDRFQPSNESLVERFNVLPIELYPGQRWHYDVELYHLGNNLFHEGIYKTALAYPGVAVLHDYALVGLISSMTWAREDFGGFFREWGYVYGKEGVARARRVLDGQETLPPEEPLNRRIIDVSLGIIVHSDFVRRQILAVSPRSYVSCVPMPWVSHRPQGLTRQAARQNLGLEGGGLYIGSFGFMAPSKQVEPLLDALSLLLRHFPNLHLFFVGEPLSWYDPKPLIVERGLSDHVTVTGYLPMSTWYTFISAVDVGVNLRYPTLGETSASVLRLMGEGIPTIVSDVGWYAELPEDSVVKVGVGELTGSALCLALVNLLDDPEQRAQTGERGRKYVETRHDAHSVAARYAEILEQVLQRFRL
jgi:glycosyltransferase involved in cell wall biosynthesis